MPTLVFPQSSRPTPNRSQPTPLPHLGTPQFSPGPASFARRSVAAPLEHKPVPHPSHQDYRPVKPSPYDGNSPFAEYPTPPAQPPQTTRVLRPNSSPCFRCFQKTSQVISRPWGWHTDSRTKGIGLRTRPQNVKAPLRPNQVGRTSQVQRLTRAANVRSFPLSAPSHELLHPVPMFSMPTVRLWHPPTSPDSAHQILKSFAAEAPRRSNRRLSEREDATPSPPFLNPLPSPCPSHAPTDPSPQPYQAKDGSDGSAAFAENLPTCAKNRIRFVGFQPPRNSGFAKSPGSVSLSGDRTFEAWVALLREAIATQERETPPLANHLARVSSPDLDLRPQSTPPPLDLFAEKAPPRLMG